MVAVWSEAMVILTASGTEARNCVKRPLTRSTVSNDVGARLLADNQQNGGFAIVQACIPQVLHGIDNSAQIKRVARLAPFW